jgi:hypothetical protein
MTESSLTQLKILVERAVRPICAGLRRKQKMREELLAHVTAVFEEELAGTGDEVEAVRRTADRFGDPRDLVGPLQSSIPARDAIDRVMDQWWYQPGEPTLRRAVRHAVILEATAFIYLAIVAALLYLTHLGGPHTGDWPIVQLGLYGGLVVCAMFLFVVSFTYLADWLRQALYGAERRSGFKAMVVAAASGLLLPALGLGLWLDVTGLSVNDFCVVVALGLLVPGALLHVAKVIAARLRHHQEWSSLAIE